MDKILEWAKDNWLLAGIVVIVAVYLINWLLKCLVNLPRVSKYKAYKNYIKLKKGMTKAEVESIMAGSKLKKHSLNLWTVYAKWRVKTNCDEKYELNIYFNSNGLLEDIKLKTKSQTWYRR